MRYAALLLVALGLAGCDTFEDDAQRTNARTSAFTFPAAFTTADARIITERENPITHQKVVCTEPSPDVAKAISTAFALSGQGGNGSASGGLGASGGSAEAVAELAGRSTALLGLRDGLYRACEAYANGVIGANAYALVLGRYGQLMTTLFLGQDIAGVAASTVVAQSPSISATANTPSGSGSTPNASVNITSGAPPAQPAATPATPATGAAAALVRMNEDYLNLDYNTLHSLAIVCLNRADPTSLASRESATGMDNICLKLAQIVDFTDLSKVTGLATSLVKGGVLASPVNPMVATPAAAPAKTPATPAKPAPAKCVALTNAQVVPVEAALEADGELKKGEPFSDTNNLVAALAAYQTKKNIKDPGCKVGQIDQTTLNDLVPPKKAPAKSPGQ